MYTMLDRIKVYILWYNMLKKAYKNHINVALDLFRNKNIIPVVLYSGKSYFLTNLYVREYAIAINSNFSTEANPEINIKENYFEFTYNSKRLRFYGFLSNGHVYNEFLDFEYKKLNFKDKVVIDIGSNIGDTPIYFALNGAKIVYAIEPMPTLFNHLIKNIEYNKINNVIPLNVAIGDKDRPDCLKLPEIDVGLDANLNNINNVYNKFMINKGNNKLVGCKTLDSLIKDIGDNEIIIKMDCEGCEYSAILGLSKQSMIKISQIGLEYHYGHEQLLEFLSRNGFKVQFTKPNKLGKLRIGILFAFKN